MPGPRASNAGLWNLHMSDEDKPRHPETNFLPPLQMILSFFKKQEPGASTAQEPEEVKQEVKRLIERINAAEDETRKPGKA